MLLMHCLLEEQMSDRYTKIVEYANDISTARLALIVQIIEKIKTSGAIFTNITKFSKEVAFRLGEIEGSSPSYTALLRKGSPYREEVQKGYTKCSDLSSTVSKESSSDSQTILEYKLALKEKNDDIDRLKRTISSLLTKLQGLESDKLDSGRIKPDTAKSQNYVFFKYLSEILNIFCQPRGPYIFDHINGFITNPMTNLPEIKEFPDGFLDFYTNNTK